MGTISVENMTMFALSNTVLLMGVQIGLPKKGVVREQSAHKRGQVLTKTIGPKDFNSSMKLGLNHKSKRSHKPKEPRSVV